MCNFDIDSLLVFSSYTVNSGGLIRVEGYERGITGACRVVRGSWSMLKRRREWLFKYLFM